MAGSSYSCVIEIIIVYDDIFLDLHHQNNQCCKMFSVLNMETGFSLIMLVSLFILCAGSSHMLEP